MFKKMTRKVKNYIIDVEFKKKDIDFWQLHALNQPNDDEIWNEYRKAVKNLSEYKKKHKFCGFVYKHLKKGL